MLRMHTPSLTLIAVNPHPRLGVTYPHPRLGVTYPHSHQCSKETKKEDSDTEDEQATTTTPEKASFDWLLSVDGFMHVSTLCRSLFSFVQHPSPYQDKLWTFPVLEASVSCMHATTTTATSLKPFVAGYCVGRRPDLSWAVHRQTRHRNGVCCSLCICGSLMCVHMPYLL